MKLFKMVGLFAAMAVTCAGCSDGASAKSADERKMEIQIQGMKPEDYYNQFVAKVTGDCAKHDIYFHFTSVRSVVISKNESGRDVRAEFDIYLRANHTYTAYYSELDIYEYTELGYKYNITYEDKLSGTWSVDGEKIVFSELGEGTSLRYNDSPAFELKFDRDLKTAGLNGKVSIASQVMSRNGDQSEEDYCAAKR